METNRDTARKCPNTNAKRTLNVRETPSAYARPQARAVRTRKKESRYVKDGSGRCHVFLVSGGLVRIAHEQHQCAGGQERTLVIVHGPEHLLRREEQAGHLPHGHLEVHLGEFEESLEEPWHADGAVTLGGRLS